VNIELSPLFLGQIICPAASSKFKTHVADPLIPILLSIEPVETPFLGPKDPSSLTLIFGTKNKLIPFVPCGASRVLTRTK